MMNGRIEIDENGVYFYHPKNEGREVECIYPQLNLTAIHLCIPPQIDAQIVWHW